MKPFKLLILLLFTGLVLQAQLPAYKAPKLTSSGNYIYTVFPQNQFSTISLEAVIDKGGTATRDMFIEDVKYFDGLGRPLEEVAIGQTPKYRDIITFHKYDMHGRESEKFLPFAWDNEGKYLTAYNTVPEYCQYMFYQESRKYIVANYQDLEDIPIDNEPQAITVYESSPLNRVLEQSAPGFDWQPSSSHTSKIEYKVNADNEVILFKVVDNTFVNDGFFVENELYKTITKDENWSATSGNLHTTEEFKDKQGQVVLKRTYVENSLGTGIDKMDTYYVYDDFGLLRFVIPPEAVHLMDMPQSGISNQVKMITTPQSLDHQEFGVTAYLVTSGASLKLIPGYVFKASSASSLSISASNVSGDLIYSYQYDARKRMVVKQIPGAAPVYMVYDLRDRLVATQDGEMRSKGQWLFTKYDVLNRPIATGILSSNQSRIDLQALVDTYDDAITSKKLYESTGGTVHGYTNNSFPFVADENACLSVIYYDDYAWTNTSVDSYYNGLLATFNNHGFTSVTLPTIARFDRVKGQVTGTKTKVLDGNNKWLTSVTFYDNRYRPILVQADNYVDGEDIVLNRFDFVGKVMETWQCHTTTKPTANKRIVRSENKYDHAGRLLTVQQQMTGAPDLVTIVENIYNELGQLRTKKVGGGLQQMDYAYNIRGWLKSINNPDDAITGNKQFAMRLHYNDAVSNITNSAQYNGNISAMEWRTPARSEIGLPTEVKQGFGYSYDAVNRLTAADYGAGSTLTTYADHFNETIDNYDLNGNIGSATRNKGNVLIDNMAYTYAGNQLLAVNDDANDADGFEEISQSGVEYKYDLNGNMTQDRNKGLTSITYNELNLPKQLTDTNGKTISYIYSANGQKLAKKGTDGTTTYYAGNFVYTGNTLSYILHPEGTYVVAATGGGYHYNLKDHLGNVRLVVNSSNTVVDQTDYYAFGMSMRNKYASGFNNLYKYNGKELQEDVIGASKLDWLDYGARMYDAQIGRWMAIDPKSEKFYFESPYCYVGNNVLLFLDPDGQEKWKIFGKVTLTQGKVGVEGKVAEVGIGGSYVPFGGSELSVEGSTTLDKSSGDVIFGLSGEHSVVSEGSGSGSIAVYSGSSSEKDITKLSWDSSEGGQVTNQNETEKSGGVFIFGKKETTTDKKDATGKIKETKTEEAYTLKADVSLEINLLIIGIEINFGVNAEDETK